MSKETKAINWLTWLVLNAIIWGSIFGIHIFLKITAEIVLAIVFFYLLVYFFQKWLHISSEIKLVSAQTKDIKYWASKIVFIVLSIACRILILADVLYCAGNIFTIPNEYGDLFILPVLAIPVLVLSPLLYLGILWVLGYAWSGATAKIRLKINADPELSKKFKIIHWSVIILICLINAGTYFANVSPPLNSEAQMPINHSHTQSSGMMTIIDSDAPIHPQTNH